MRGNGPAGMPRTTIEPQFTIEHLSILDSDGNLDSALDPRIPADELQRVTADIRCTALGGEDVDGHGISFSRL